MGVSCFESGKNRVDLKPEYIQQIMEENAFKGDQIASLKKENTDYKTKNSNLKAEIKQLKNMCSQYQLMLQNLMYNNLFLNNQINNMNNFQGNLMNYNNNNQNNNLIKTFIFHLDNGQKCQTLSIDRCRLGDLYYIAFAQINNEAYRYINNLQFLYNAEDITKHFLYNDFVGSLKLPNFSVIYVMKLKNI